MSELERKYMGAWALAAVALIALVIALWWWQASIEVQAQTPVVETA